MPSIAEFDDDAPEVPDKSRHRPLGRNSYHYPGYPAFPPPYSTDTPSSRDTNPLPEPEPKKQRLPGWALRRGGWCRVALLVLLVIAIILALVLGLVLGLRNRK
jgi:hypothetical protein